MNKPTIAAIIITKNEEAMIANCLETVQWCDASFVIDTGSDDKTVDIAKKNGAEVFSIPLTSFANVRNFGLSKASQYNWVLYIDADERVTPVLAKEISVQLETTSANALKLQRQNMLYGKFFHHGGWESDSQTRAFKVSEFKGWSGDIHESPILSSEPVLLHNPLLHFTHRNTVENLQKSASWTPMEAKLLFEANTPKVTGFTLVRKGLMEVLRRYIFKAGYKDGMHGFVESLVQGINRILVYIQLWELQQKPSLPDSYLSQEKMLYELWKKEK